jgi:enoyl-CoA hydratase/carnithine racemase
VRVTRLIGVGRTMDMMLTGRSYGAEEGAALGFSQYVVAPGEGMAKAIELARRVARNTRMNNYAILQALPRIATADPQTGLLMESLVSAIAQDSGDAKQRVRAFLDKRAQKAPPG